MQWTVLGWTILKCFSPVLNMRVPGSMNFLTNLTLFNQDLIDGLQASISVYNLFDRTYSNPDSEEHLQDQIEQDGRSFWLKLDYTF